MLVVMTMGGLGLPCLRDSNKTCLQLTLNTKIFHCALLFLVAHGWYALSNQMALTDI